MVMRTIGFSVFGAWANAVCLGLGGREDRMSCVSNVECGVLAAGTRACKKTNNMRSHLCGERWSA